MKSRSRGPELDCSDRDYTRSDSDYKTPNVYSFRIFHSGKKAQKKSLFLSLVLLSLEAFLSLGAVISSRKALFESAHVCVDEYRWTGLLMATVGVETSPSILSVVTDPVPLLQIVNRARAHPEDHPAALYFSPANDQNRTGTRLWSAKADTGLCWWYGIYIFVYLEEISINVFEIHFWSCVLPMYCSDTFSVQNY